MTTVRMRHRSPEGHDRDGNLFVKPELLEWLDVEYRPIGSCDHQETACRQCLDTWELDYEVDLGDAGELEEAWAEAELEPPVDVVAPSWGPPYEDDLDGYVSDDEFDWNGEVS